MDREQIALELAIAKLRNSNTQTDQPMMQLSRYYHEIKGYMNIQDSPKNSLMSRTPAYFFPLFQIHWET